MDTLFIKKWTIITNEFSIPQELSDKWLKIVWDHYDEGWRYYHTTNHIKELFKYYDKYYSSLNNSIVVALTIFFHDVIYEPKKTDNEEKSVELFQEYAREINLSQEVTEKVSTYIMNTKSHSTMLSSDLDLQYFLDFDLSILGQSDEVYAQYAENIRKEYIHIPDDLFKQGRTAILIKLSEKGDIYKTAEFKKLYEDQAKLNMKNEIAKLAS
jgi:predicted metal-dependent HD superfamily phosphohydrolase